MRKITEQAARAFLAGKTFNGGNTVVIVNEGGRIDMMLHGNHIAERRSNDEIWATLAGWPTPTTRERINGLCVVLGLPAMVCQRKGKQYFGRNDAYGLEKSGIPEREITIDEWFRIV